MDEGLRIVLEDEESELGTSTVELIELLEYVGIPVDEGLIT